MQHPFLLRQVSPTRNRTNTSPNALRNKWNWSHLDVAILYKSECSLRGHRVGTLKAGFLYSLPLRFWGLRNQFPKTLVLCADRGAPGTPPCGVGSVSK